MQVKTLVVDNNPVLLKAICSMLNRENCEVRSAKTGLEALEILDQYEPDIVFTDLVMPQISGEQLCRILRSSTKHRDVYIVVISAIILEDRERILSDVDFDLCIAKGTLKELRQHLREALAAFQERKSADPDTDYLTPIIPDSLKPSEVAAELLAGKQHLAQILENIDEGIIELNKEGKIVGANKAALKILARREEDLSGKEIEKIGDWGEYSAAVNLWKIRQLVGRGRQSFKILEDDPLVINNRIVTAAFIPVSEQGKNFGLCILRDISRQYYAEKYSKDLDDAIKLAKKMDALSCMAGGLAHDFNNLLTVICGNLEMLSTYWDKQSEQEKGQLVEQTRKSAMVAVDLTRQISCFSNFGIVSRERNNFKELVKSSLEQFSSKIPVKYEVRFQGDDVIVEVDPDEIHRVIENVLQNAIEAAPDKEIVISAGVTRITSPQLMSGQFVPAGNYARIDITDSGPGIDGEALVRVFDPYYSTKERGVHKGMGLGLTIVYATMRNHGGYVIVKADQADKERHEKKSGTTVSLYLPVRDFLYSEVLGVRSLAEKNISLLLIEPDSQMREIGKVMVTHLGFNAIAARTRTEAIQQLKKFDVKTVEELPLAIIDVSDLNTESPIETCRQLRKIVPSIKIIAMSGGNIEPIMEKCQAHGFVNSITKPYTMDTLRHIVLSALQS